MFRKKKKKENEDNIIDVDATDLADEETKDDDS